MKYVFLSFVAALGGVLFGYGDHVTVKAGVIMLKKTLAMDAA